MKYSLVRVYTQKGTFDFVLLNRGFTHLDIVEEELKSLPSYYTQFAAREDADYLYPETFCEQSVFFEKIKDYPRG